MKVVRVITRLNSGGPSFQAEHLSRALAARGHETLLVHGALSPAEAGEPARWRLAPRREEVPCLARAPHPVRDLRALCALLRILRRERPDIVHTHQAKAGALGRLAARLAGVPVVVHTFHGNVLSGYFRPSAERAVAALERWLARSADVLIAVSPSQKADLAGRFRIAPEGKLRVVALGLDLGPFLAAAPADPSVRAALGIPEGAPVAALVARLEPVKDVPAFLRIAARVRAELPAARFLVVGEGKLRAALEAESRALGISEAVRFLGQREDLPRILSAVDAVCLTSRNEGTPVALIEAMAAGRAVVSYAVGGVPDVVEEGRTGRLAAPGDERAFARILAGLLADEGERKRLGAAARARVAGAYDPERLADDVEKLYRELLARRP